MSFFGLIDKKTKFIKLVVFINYCSFYCLFASKSLIRHTKLKVYQTTFFYTMKFGIGRVSKFEQNLDLQIDAFIKEGIDPKNIYVDKITRKTDKRPNYEKCLSLLREGDVVYAWKLDRIVGSIIQLNKLVNRLDEIGASLVIITQPFIDTRDKSPHSKLIRNMFSILSEFEVDLISERTKAGLDSAKRWGVILGAPKGLSDKNKKKAKLCAHYFNEGKLTVSQICKTVEVSRATYYKYLDLEGLKDELRPYSKV